MICRTLALTHLFISKNFAPSTFLLSRIVQTLCNCYFSSPISQFRRRSDLATGKDYFSLFWVHLRLPWCNSASLSRFLDNSYFYYTILNSLSSHSTRIRTIQGSLLPTLPSLLGKPNKKLKRNRKNKDTNSSAWKIRQALRVSSRNISFWVGPGTKSLSYTKVLN